MEAFIKKEFYELYGNDRCSLVSQQLGCSKIMECAVINDILHKAYKEELIKAMKRRLHFKIEEYLDSEEFLNSHPIFREEKERVEKYKTRYIFLTINPEPSITLKMILDTLKKACSKVWMKNYIYTIEQRGATEDEIGLKPHIHMILDTAIDKKRHEIIREIKNTFKKICDISHTSIFNVKNIKDSHLKNFVNYITGVKKDVIKHPKQRIDKLFRDKYNLLPLYGDGELFEVYSNNEDVTEEFDYNF